MGSNQKPSVGSSLLVICLGYSDTAQLFVLFVWVSCSTTILMNSMIDWTAEIRRTKTSAIIHRIGKEQTLNNMEVQRVSFHWTSLRKDHWIIISLWSTFCSGCLIRLSTSWTNRHYNYLEAQRWLVSLKNQGTQSQWASSLHKRSWSILS